jgi:hypothetical protein
MFAVPGQREPVLLIAALAPLMLKLAGELADGTILWFADEHAIENHVVPRITEAAAAAVVLLRASSPRFRSRCATKPKGRERAAQTFAAYTQIPTYQRILARGSEGTGPAELVVVGDEAAIERRLRRLAAVGVTDFVAAPFPVGAGPGRVGAAHPRVPGTGRAGDHSLTNRELADELRAVLRALNEREHTPEQIATAVALAGTLRGGLDGPRRPRWYEGGIIDGRSTDGNRSSFNTHSLFRGRDSAIAVPLTLWRRDDARWSTCLRRLGHLPAVVRGPARRRPRWVSRGASSTTCSAARSS